MRKLIAPFAAALLMVGCGNREAVPVTAASAPPVAELKAESSAPVAEATAADAALRQLWQQAEITGSCTYRSPLSGKSYLYASTDDGVLQQWDASAQKNGAPAGRLLRGVPVGKGIAGCVQDDAEGVVYVADEAIGIWRIAAEPEADPGRRELVEQVAPRGRLGEEVKSIAIHATQNARHLLALDEEAATVHVYALPEFLHVGQFKLAGAEDMELEAVAVDGDRVLLMDDKTATQHALSWTSIATALKLPAGPAADPDSVSPSTARIVEPAVETESVLDFGDAADDPAIWVHPTDPAKSLIVGAQKKRGLEVYDLTGKRVQVLPDGRTNNVDLRQGVLLGGRKRDVVAGSNRERRTLALYEVNAATRRLVDAAAAPIPTEFRDPYGLCMYHSAKSGKLYVFMNNSDNGEFRQWEVEAVGDKLSAKLVREFTVGTQAEGCAADDETGALYIAEEGEGLWRYGAEPDAGDARKPIDSTGRGGHLKADVEGIGIFHGANGAGFIVVSNQGADNYALYRREGDNAFIGHFSIVASDALGIDGASETDGLDVTSAPLGNAFPHGLLVVQDGRNITPTERQNFKLVPWERVATVLGL